jgi:hypothetical protein
MSLFTAYSGRGSILVWRQSEAAPVGPGTGDQRSRFQVYSRGRVVVWPRRLAAEDGGTVISVPAGALTLTGYAPTVSTPVTIAVPVAALSLAGFAPTVSTVAGGTVVDVPAGAMTLTGYAPTVTVTTVISIPAGGLALSGFAPTVYTTAGTTVDIPAGGLSLTGFAPVVYTLGGSTESVMYLPVRSFANGEGTAVENTTLDTLKSLLPRQPQKVVLPDGTMDPAWYRFMDYMVNNYFGSLNQPTIQSIVAQVEEGMAAATIATQTTALLAQQTQANAEALAATVEVVTNNSLPGSIQIPPVSRSYLEP